jgi:hypothetical protein
LPGGKIPDRRDFTRLATAARVAVWRECIARSEALAEVFQTLLAGPDPLAGATLLN